MKIHESYLSILAVVLIAMTGQANAVLIDGPDIIAAPSSVVNNAAQGGAENDHQQAFDEKQGVLLTEPLAVDSGTIAAGKRVNSHMIFLNTPGLEPAWDQDKVWTFDGPFLGVMSDSYGDLEFASTPILGAVGNTYPDHTFFARGFDNIYDDYYVDGNEITVSMRVVEPGD